MAAKRPCPCEGGTVVTLPLDEVKQRVATLALWSVAVSDGQALLRRAFVARNFAGAMSFLNGAASIAENLGHHPNMSISAYRNVTVDVYTHSVSGITDLDFELAAKLDTVPVVYSPKFLKDNPEIQEAELEREKKAAETIARGGSRPDALQVVFPGDIASFKDKTVLITGCSRGLGLGFVTELLVAGARVIASCRDPDSAVELKTVLQEHAGDCFPILVKMDTDDWESITSAVAEISIKTGVIDVLINNAGRSNANHPVDPIKSCTKSDMLGVYGTNVCGSTRMTQAVLPLMASSAVKKIVNVSSGLASIQNVLAYQGGTSNPGGIASYRCSKAALNMMSRVFAAELAEDGFTVVALSPGWVQTDQGSQGGRNPPLDIKTSIQSCLRVAAGLEASKHNGKYVNYDGTALPY
eukprot:TRINITY_DN21523_c0_g1_i1.p1 TRINITY_DN21523_c0_g1~~TRINITY_DN21523_c0_g1_i1.p1  ORF type:complete len:411 (-),score=67.59 TRINITY_DN21523_c0_g1_i1:169-1401(-)